MTKPVFVDTNVFIYASGNPHPYKNPSKHFLEKAAKNQIKTVTNSEVLQEILHRYHAIGELGRGFLLFDDCIQIVVTTNILIKSKKLKELNHSLRLSVSCDTKPLSNTYIGLSEHPTYSMKGFVEVAVRGDGECIEVKITDTGPGMSEEDVNNLFVPFHKIGGKKNFVEGAGLGLTIVKEVLDVHKGRIKVKSKPGEGTEFIVSWPALREDNAPGTNRMEGSL